METMTRSELLGQYDVKKLLIKLALPATAGMVINALYNLVDTFFVGQGVGTVAITALGFAFPVQVIIMAFGLMFGIGAASVFSRAYGRQDHEQMRHVANTAIRIDLIVALIFSITGFFFIRPLLEFFGANEDNMQYGIDYLSVILIGLAPLTMSMVLNSLTRAEGRAKIAMYSMIIGAGLNIVLDPIFIFVLDMGVRGAAIATVISQIVGFTYIFLQSQSNQSELHMNVKEWLDIDLNTIWEIIKIGFPTFLRNGIGAFLMVYIFRVIIRYGGDDITMYQAIYTTINRVIMFILFPAFGLNQGLAPVAGFNYGAKNYKRLHDVIIFAIKISVVYFLMAFLFVQLMAPLIFTAFSKENLPFFIDNGARIFRIISIGFVVIGFQILLGSLYQSLGYPIRAMLVALSRQFLLFVPIALILTSIFDLNGLWYTFASADLIAGVLSLFAIIYELRVIYKKHQELPSLG
ncbi:MATE family efflux transporter [Candidatus Xianfuyuplasma coldseepsis]|uniref:Multidrug export protein MepA n=1 Tax=Candidatus Xianfuyuplasma coldseepsis TaxID=2782163 RepID=A0A7L7KTB1_9MOLU|nr:MATE family efflux transporter [Xianfuyuplasma coldseepsis]QMS85476.1 MATE family efflux transporter [Xianfuyuplasma coldseepsis]